MGLGGYLLSSEYGLLGLSQPIIWPQPGSFTLRGVWIWDPPSPSGAYGICSSPQLGPNVSIGEGVTVGEGVRLRESIVLHGATLQVGTRARSVGPGALRAWGW